MSNNSLDTTHSPRANGAIYDWLDGTRSVTTKASPTVTNAVFSHREVEITTSGSGAAEKYSLGTTATVKPGHRKLITLAKKGVSGDSVTIDYANLTKGSLTVSAAALTTVGQFLLVEARRGSGSLKWEVIDASSGVVTAA